MLTLTDIKWCAEECERQDSGELSVSNMCNALSFARENGRMVYINDIKLMGQIVEPAMNARGFRDVPVHFFDLTRALDAWKIDRALSQLLEHGGNLTSVEWYTEFERIHPFLDGNGRVGAILFNVKNGTIKAPITPPDVFGLVRAERVPPPPERPLGVDFDERGG